MSNLTELLLATQNPAHVAQAEAMLKQAEQSNVQEYLQGLAAELANREKPQMARQLAGLLLKNGLAARDANKDPQRDLELKQRWQNLPDPCRDTIKQNTTSALIASEMDVSKAAAQVLAKIGRIEIPLGKWDGLVPFLLTHVTNTDVRARQVALIALGYLCEELVVIQETGGNISVETSNNILTAVIQGMRSDEPETKLHATRAFYHAVVLAKQNFQSDTERNMIMEVLHSICRGPTQEVQIAGFECLVQVATEYYDYLLQYCAVLGPLTWETIRGGHEKVGIPAMEFWSTICDEELELMWLASEGRLGQRPMHNIVQQALPQLCPLLTEMLTRKDQNEHDDEDNWNISMAAGTCLSLVAQVTGDACVDGVLQFCGANFSHADWRFREAAILAYGSIMEGPSSDKMRPVVSSSFEQLVARFEDPSVAVRDTLAWTLGRVAQFHPTVIPVKPLIPILGRHLTPQEKPRVVANVCWVIQVLAEAQKDGVAVGQACPTTPLSEFFLDIAGALIQTTARADADEKQLRMRAYEALSALVANSGDDCLQRMFNLVEEMLGHLERSFQAPVTSECELQGYICGVLTVSTFRLKKQIAPAADKIVEGALKTVQGYQQVKQSPGAVKDEALLLIQSIAMAVGSGFDRYMQPTWPVIKAALEHHEDEAVCNLATGLVSDLCYALDAKIAPFADNIVEILLSNLKNPVVGRRIKASITSCFGSLATALKGQFEKYIAHVVPILQEASTTRLTDGNPLDEDWVEYLNELRENVLESYANIILTLKESNALACFKVHVHPILLFVGMITDEQSVSEAVLKATLGLVGDLFVSFQHELMSALQGAPFLVKLVEAARRSGDMKIRQEGERLQNLLRKFGFAGC